MDDKATKKRWIRRTVLLVVLAVVFGPYLVIRFASPGRVVQVFNTASSNQPPNASGEVSILIYNIAHGRGAISSNLEEGGAEKRARIKQIAKLIQDVDADIVILNEADFCATWSGHQNQAEALAIKD